MNKTGGNETKNQLATVRVEQLDKMDVTTFGQKSAELDLEVNFSHKIVLTLQWPKKPRVQFSSIAREVGWAPL